MSRHSTAHYFLEGLVDLGVEYIFANLGTDGASPDIRDGDVVEIDITGIGTLRNKFVAEKR